MRTGQRFQLWLGTGLTAYADPPLARSRRFHAPKSGIDFVPIGINFDKNTIWT